MLKKIKLRVNGRDHAVEVEAGTPLLYVLRNDLQLNGPKYGCGKQQCGACYVLIDGEARSSCMFPVEKAEGREIVTLDGLGTPQKLHPIQKAFIDEQAAQCGYCTNGMIIATKALLDRHPKPTEEQIRAGLRPVLCRCGTYTRVIKAVQRAAKELA